MKKLLVIVLSLVMVLSMAACSLNATPEETPTEAPPVAEKGSSEVKTVNVELNVLKNGSRGNQVKTAQRLLSTLRYHSGSVEIGIVNILYAVGNDFQWYRGNGRRGCHIGGRIRHNFCVDHIVAPLFYPHHHTISACI